MKLIDTHCHLNKEYYEDIENVIKRAKDNNIEYIIVSSCNPNDWQENIDLSDKYENIYLNISLHPEIGNEDIDYKIYLKEMKNIIKNNKKIIAIGEIGLDYHYENTNKEKQKELFVEQIKLAEEFNLPIVIHTRDATKDTIETLKSFNVKGIIHCFSGSIEIGLEHVVLETDSPYLSPIRGNKNMPENIKIIAEYLATLLNITVEEVALKTTLNVKKIYNIDF